MNLTGSIFMQRTTGQTTTTTTTTTELVPPKDSNFIKLRIPLQRRTLPANMQFQVYPSGNIKSPLGRFRNKVSILSPSVL